MATRTTRTTSRNLSKVSNPELVRIIRKHLAELTAWRLKNFGKELPENVLLRAALDEAKRRHLTIQHPEIQK